MTTKTIEDKKINVVTDMFAQCEACNKWERLDPQDEYNERLIPLRNVIHPETGNTVKWICYTCYDEIENKCYNANLSSVDSDEGTKFRRMFLDEVNKKRKLSR